MQLIRIAVFLPCLAILLISLIKVRKSALVIFLTQQGNHLTVLTTLLTVHAGRFRNKGRPLLKRVTAILLEVTFVTQIVITSIYWPILHHIAMERIKTEPDGSFLYYHMIFIHSVPFIAVLVNVTLSKVRFIPGHSLYIVLYGIFYSCVNYAGTLYRGHPLYPFLNWQDYRSLIVCGILNLVIFLLFQMVTAALCILKEKKQYTLTERDDVKLE